MVDLPKKKVGINACSGSVSATCSCGSDIPVQIVDIAGQKVTLITLPLIFEQFQLAGKVPSVSTTAADLLETARIYTQVLQCENEAYCQRKQNTQ